MSRQWRLRGDASISIRRVRYPANPHRVLSRHLQQQGLNARRECRTCSRGRFGQVNCLDAFRLEFVAGGWGAVRSAGNSSAMDGSFGLAGIASRSPDGSVSVTLQSIFTAGFGFDGEGGTA